MAQGTPTVGANACGIQDVIRHGKTGYLANNLNEFTVYAIKLLKDDDLRAEMSKNCQILSNNYRHSKIARTWIKIYKFTINELCPLRYYGKDRKERVNLIKEFAHKTPRVSF